MSGHWRKSPPSLTSRSIKRRRRIIMAIVPAFHSVLETDRKVYHDSSLCTEGNNIEAKNRRAGTGGRPRCERCADRERGGR